MRIYPILVCVFIPCIRFSVHVFHLDVVFSPQTLAVRLLTQTGFCA